MLGLQNKLTQRSSCHAQPHTVSRLNCNHAIHCKAQQVETSPAQVKQHTCRANSLKEWAVTVGALGKGEQTVLFRKGGIREPTFKPEYTEFLLFPTSFHTDQDLLKPGVAQRYAQEMALEPKQQSVLSLPYYAQLTGAWTTFDPAVFSALDPLHVWTEAFVETRLKWRKAQPITVLELRTWVLREPLQLLVKEEYFGCFSWVDLSEALGSQLSLDGARPALDDAIFANKQRQLRQGLSKVEVQDLQLESPENNTLCIQQASE